MAVLGSFSNGTGEGKGPFEKRALELLSLPGLSIYFIWEAGGEVFFQLYHRFHRMKKKKLGKPSFDRSAMNFLWVWVRHKAGCYNHVLAHGENPRNL